MEKKLSKQEFDSILKIFKRFLKEEGRYHLVINYLFPIGRTKEDMIDAINNETYTSFKNIFIYGETLGPNYQIYGHDFWEKYICKLHYRWIDYYNHYYLKVM